MGAGTYLAAAPPFIPHRIHWVDSRPLRRPPPSSSREPLSPSSVSCFAVVCPPFLAYASLLPPGPCQIVRVLFALRMQGAHGQELCLLLQFCVERI